MGARSVVTTVLVGCSLLAGCSGPVQAGLANVPGNPPGVLGGTAEMRVHDVIANGHDACEGYTYPPGGVLRGQIPPCGETSRAAVTLAAPPTSRPRSVCPAPETSTGSTGRTGSALLAFPPTRSRLWLACDPSSQVIVP